MNSKPIFISHSSKDHAVAEKICDALENNGLKCWIAPRDIPYGKAWAGEISKTIANSCTFLFLSSENSNSSDQVSREIQLAIQHNLMIIPIRLDNSSYSDANSYYLATLHCMIEYNESKLHKLVADISDAVASQLPQQEPDAPAESQQPAQKKQKKVRKPRPMLTMGLIVLHAFLWAAAASYLFFFVEFNNIVKYSCIAIVFAAVLLPVFLCSRKAKKAYTASPAKLNVLCVTCVLGMGLLFAGGFFLENHIWNTDISDKYVFTLEAPEEMSAVAYEQSIETVRERVKIFMGEERHSVTVDGTKINIIIPVEALGDIDPTVFMKAYISRSINLFLSTAIWHLNTDQDQYPNEVEVLRSCIQSIAIKEGSPEGIDLTQHGIETDPGKYIELILDESFVAQHAETLAYYGDEISFMQDILTSSSYYGFTTVRSEKENVFYIYPDDILNAYETVVYNYSNEPMADSLLVTVKIPTVWENINDISSAGANQCNIKDLDKDCTTFTFSRPYSQTISDGEWLDTMRALKLRLDALGQPYALGTTINDPYTINIKTKANETNIVILKAITENNFTITGGFSYTSIPDSYSQSQYLLSNNETEAPAVSVSPYSDEKMQIFEMLAGYAANTSKKQLYLTLGSYRTKLLSMDVSTVDDFSALSFSTLQTSTGSQPLDADTAWVPAVIEAMYLNKLPVNLAIEAYEADNGIQLPTVEDDWIAEIRTGLQHKVPEFNLFTLTGTLYFDFSLPVDENLPASMIDIAKQIIENVDLEASPFNSITIYYIDEVGDERARIFFYKSYNSIYMIDSHTDGFIEISGIMANGRVASYAQTLRTMAYEDELLKNYIHEEDGYTAFD